MRLKEFNLREIEPSSSWIILGPPGSGKTSFIENLLYANRHVYPVGRVVCSVPGPHKRWSSIFPPLFVHSEFVLEEEESFLQRQQRLATKDGIGKFAANVYDDPDIPKHVYSNMFFQKLVKRGSRHLCCLTVLADQYALEFPPELRSAASYVVIMKYTSNVDLKKLYNNYGCSSYFSEQEFRAAISEYTGPGKCIIVKQRANSSNIEECVFKCSIDPPPNSWKFGCKEMWKYNNQRLDGSKQYSLD